MLISGMKSVLQVHEEGVALLAKVIFAERVREVGLMEKIGCSDPNEMGAPQFQMRTIEWKFVHMLSNRTKEGSDTLSSDLMAAQSPGVVIHGYWEESQKMEAMSTLVNEDHGPDWIEDRM